VALARGSMCGVAARAGAAGGEGAAARAFGCGVSAGVAHGAGRGRHARIVARGADIVAGAAAICGGLGELRAVARDVCQARRPPLPWVARSK